MTPVTQVTGRGRGPIGIKTHYEDGMVLLPGWTNRPKRARTESHPFCTYNGNWIYNNADHKSRISEETKIH